MTLSLVTLNPLEMLPPEDPLIDDVLARLQLQDAAATAKEREVETEKEDACRYFYKLCRRLDTAFLQPREITCLFDVDGGWLPGKSCRTVGLIVTTLVIDVSARARVRPKNGVITITLHRWEAVWSCSVADRGIFAVQSLSSRPPEFVERLVKRLNARLEHHATEDGTMTAFTFEPSSRPLH